MNTIPLRGDFVKRYIKCKTTAKWEKEASDRYNLYEGNDWIASVYKKKAAFGMVRWYAQTENYTSVWDTLAEAKQGAIRNIEIEAQGRVEDMQRMEYTSEEMAEECKVNPYLRYMGISL